MARPRTFHAARFAAMASLGAMLVALLAGGGGCELAIGDTIPAYACDPGADTCPANAVCVPSTHQCIAAGVTCPVTGCKDGMQCDPYSLTCTVIDATSSDDGPATDTSTGGDGDAAVLQETAPPDTSTSETVGPCRALGCKCSGGVDCDSGICADALSVTYPGGSPPTLWSAAGSAGFCTRPCCTSSDCDTTTVCYATASGGNYCVNPLWVGRAVDFGAQLGGSSCNANSQCRSGLCTGSKCADPCCSTNAAANTSDGCATGTSCRFGKFPGATSFDQNYVASCGSAGSGSNGSTCNAPTDCKSDLCDSNFNGNCRNACRSTADCGSASVSCAYITVTGNPGVVAACFPQAGNTPEGGTCAQDSDCQSQFCDPSKVCTDVCFANSDCTKTGWRCRPEVVTVQGGGSYSVLACGS